MNTPPGTETTDRKGFFEIFIEAIAVSLMMAACLAVYAALAYGLKRAAGSGNDLPPFSSLAWACFLAAGALVGSSAFLAFVYTISQDMPSWWGSASIALAAVLGAVGGILSVEGGPALGARYDSLAFSRLPTRRQRSS